MTIINVACGIACVLLGFAFCQLCHDIFERDDTDKLHYVKLAPNRIVIDFDSPDENGDNLYSSEHHFYDYDLSKQDFVITGDRHADTIEKSFSKNNFRHAKEYWKYTFEDGESEKSDHPLSNEEMEPLVDIHGPVKQDGLEVIKV